MKRLILVLTCLFLAYLTLTPSFADEKNPKWITEFPKKATVLSGLDEKALNTVIKVFNENDCTCCKKETLAHCLKNDAKCGYVQAIAKKIIAKAKKGKSEDYLSGMITGYFLYREVELAKKAKKADNKIYKINVDNSPWKGTEDAPVTIVEFTDFQCPYCVRASATVEEVLKAYPTQIKIRFKNNPLSFHKQAPYAARAALAAGEQGKYWEMRKILFKNSRALNEESIRKFAQEIGLDMEQFEKTVNSQELKDRVQADMKEAKRVKARGTPHFFVNGRRLKGAQPFNKFKAIIDEELAKLKAKPAS